MTTTDTLLSCAFQPENHLNAGAYRREVYYSRTSKLYTVRLVAVGVTFEATGASEFGARFAAERQMRQAQQARRMAA